VVDQLTRSCVARELETDRRARLIAAGRPIVANATNITSFCGDDARYMLSPDGRCHFASACVTAGLIEFIDWVRVYTALGAVLLAVVYALAAALFVPGSLLTLGGGAAFVTALGLGPGVLVGSLSVFAGAFLGAILAFVLGRFALHELVHRLLQRWRITKAIDAALEEEGFKVMLLLRLSPLIPFNALNYVMAGTSISLRSYTLALFGMLPGTVAFVYIGGSVAEAAMSGASGGEGGAVALRVVLLVLGGVFAFAAAVAISVYAKKQLDRSLDQHKGAASDDVDEADEATPPKVAVSQAKVALSIGQSKEAADVP